MEIKQYQIVLVNLDPTVGGEIKKSRPCVVISPNEMNKYLQTIIVAPMTSSSKNYPTPLFRYKRLQFWWVVIDQIRTIDKARITKKLGSLSQNEIDKVKLVIKETLVD